jgi:hypothetical protein
MSSGNGFDNQRVPSLQDRLDEFKRMLGSEAAPYNVPREAIEKMHQTTGELKASGTEDRTLKVGDRAPSFTLFSQDHVQVASTGLPREGPLVIASSGDTGESTASWSWKLSSNRFRGQGTGSADRDAHPRIRTVHARRAQSSRTCT